MTTRSTRRLRAARLLVIAVFAFAAPAGVRAQAAADSGVPAPGKSTRPVGPSVAAVPEPPIDYDTSRTEFAGAPLIAGNSDIGLEFGAVVTATHFGEGTRPYQWNTDMVLYASVKGGPSGAEVAQQNYLMQLDMPDVVPKRVRFTITSYYVRTVDYGYFGVNDQAPLRTHHDGRFYQFDQREGQARTLTKLAVSGPWALLFAFNLRYIEPHAYADSQLQADYQAGQVRGLRALGQPALGFGFAYDTRDNEFFPNRGVLHMVGIKGSYDVPLSASVGYATLSGIASGFIPVTGPLVLALRGLIDMQAGNVPFYDLAFGGVFNNYELPGGPSGIRGVPIGRYRGLMKMVGNAELRALLYRFRLLGADFHLGGDVFTDIGRAFRDYTFRRDRVGTGLGIAWGAGGGLYLQWGQAAVFRADFAYSPDASANGGFPLGVYVAEGTMF